jgi:hypothetical protein
MRNYQKYSPHPVETSDQHMHPQVGHSQRSYHSYQQDLYLDDFLSNAHPPIVEGSALVEQGVERRTPFVRQVGDAA